MSENPLVLVADDDEAMRSLMRISLENQGYEVLEAENGQQALDCFSNNKIDLVLLDVRMPVMDGYEACKAMREIDADHVTPIVMVTGLDDESAITHAFLAGADEFIIKPINWTLLSHQIDFWVCSSQAINAERKGGRLDRELLRAIPDSVFRLFSPEQVDSAHLGTLGKMLAWDECQSGSSLLEDYFPADVVTHLQEPILLAKHKKQASQLVVDALYPKLRPLRLVFRIFSDDTGAVVIIVREDSRAGLSILT